MVHIIPENRRRSMGQELAGGIAEGLPDAISQFQNYQRMQNENAALKNQIGLDLTGIMDPQTRQTLIADQLKFGRTMKQQRAASEVDNLGQDARNKVEEFDEFRSQQPRTRKPQAPTFGNFRDNAQQDETSKFFPTLKGGSEEPGQRPQTETSGGKYQKRTLKQREDDALRNLEQKTDKGIETTYENELALIDSQEGYKDQYNKQIDTELGNRVNFQERYGNIVDDFVEGLKGTDPIKSPKIRSLLKANAEKFAGKDTSEAAIRRAIAEDVDRYSNYFSEFDKAIPRGNFAAKVGRMLDQTDRGKKSIQDMRLKAAPLLKAGLYDEVRSMLSAKEFRPEMIETILGDLGEDAMKSVANLPTMGPTVKSHWNMTPQEMMSRNNLEGPKLEQFQQNLRDTLKADPSANLILLRKAYGEKGVDWEDFWDSLSQMQASGEFKPTDDQFKQLNDLSQPPLSGLDQLFKYFGLIDVL